MLAIALGLAAAAQDVPVVTAADPVSLFDTVCRGDRTKLSRKDFANVEYAALPQGARNALGFALPRGGAPATKPPFARPAGDVPNRFLAALPARKAFLILPAPEASGEVAPVCGVIWQGNHYADALKAAQRFAGNAAIAPATLHSGVRGFNYSVIRAQGAIVGAAEFNNWTVLRIAPDLTPSQDPKAP